ncbi:MAG TPA: glucose-6-phosphate isomerase, partial [Sediminispirochaeta sp.]|nr:glucose-6-phosphate isomerase [Sediminispirochaeta sp.]
ETLTNHQLVVRYLEKHAPRIKPADHMVAVTSETSPLAGSPDFLTSFYIDDFIGGRYSSTSAVGATVLSLCFGAEEFQKFLNGAQEADRLALSSDIRSNAALIDAAIGVYLGNVHGYRVSAVLPYSQALLRFPAHLQQLDMESNGKQVNRDGQPVNYPTGMVIFGEPGTNGQHSFYQLLHQGTERVLLQFIGFRENQQNLDLKQDGYSSRQKLNANLVAQILAFAKGQENQNPNKNFPGERPSSLLFADELSPGALGALLAHYENKVMFQGFFWNLNSFDQEGVQLGKKLTTQLLKGQTEDPVLSAYAALFNL